MSFKQATYDEPHIKSMQSRTTFETITGDFADSIIPQSMRIDRPSVPKIPEYDVVRHYTRLSEMNYSVDTGFYPLGSCTMKFNPKYADKIAAMPLFSENHPLRPEWSVQGSLAVMYELQEYLKEISDMDEVSLQPLAGAQGELTGVLIIRKYFQLKGELETRREIVVPDSAHGTNPASAAMGGFDVVEIPSNKNGTVDIDALKYAVTEKTAGFMITNPNTLGIFDPDILKIAEIVHSKGALLYYDGANLNAILGFTSPGIMGFDIVHFNLHKTFATPHGGGGPGAAPVAVKKHLANLLPPPIVRKNNAGYYMDYSNTELGNIASFYGSFGVLLRAWSYIKRNGADGLKMNSSRAVLNANYLAKKLSRSLKISHEGLKKHEVVFSSEETGVRALDIAKYIIDSGMHAPTVYFPLIVKEALMIEPTETVTKRDLDAFVDIIEKSLKEDHEEISKRPINTASGRLDDVKAARELILK